MKKWNLSVSDLGSWGVDALRGYLHLEAKGRSPKKCSDVIGGNKWYPAFGYTLGLGPLFFSVDEISMWNPRRQF
jgi:hypothetical protein